MRMKKYSTNNWDALAYNSLSKTLVKFRVIQNPRVLEQQQEEEMKAWLLLTNNLSCIDRMSDM
jgi:hypothetical protein